ncbi:hypothetical protein [Streptomyces boncukensis]|uniref:Uncharacterized protein n=1 Tax=Streptomyces boncukensis TaxID=2711219 RepID=A0A6G4X7C0_9ACTN|nr:hypothetical protein [Streptomyces boncukensis]NGO73436.1 hypothetical protein [Streptomyces boncukensis]
MTGDDRPTMPPVRLPSEAELARDALAAPLLSRAVKLTRWAREAGPSGVPVGAGGELLSEQLKAAAEYLGLGGGDGDDGDEEEAPDLASGAWNFAVDTGLLEVEDAEEPAGEPAGEEVAGAAWPDPASGALTGADGAPAPGPEEVLELWRNGLETVLDDATMPSLQDVLGGIEKSVDENGELDPDSIDLDELDWDPESETDFLESALGNLYLMTVSETAAAGAPVPLPVLAASMIVPEEMDEPTDEVLEEVSSAMMRLDDQFRLLEPMGLVEYQPVDEELTREAEEGEGDFDAELEDEDVTRYGMVRLTPLGLYGVRERLREAGIEAPVVGDLAQAAAGKLLAALHVYTEDTARQEIEAWLAARGGTAGAVQAARELLDAARGADEDGPVRRLACQQALSLAGPEAEPALREVLEDRQLGGLARVWLVEHGAADVPQPDEEMVFWLTVDTIAAQLATVGEPDELRELVGGLVDQHAGFFDKAWQVDHPATGEVLEAMGRVLTDKSLAKAARKAAFKARSAER